MCEITGNPSTVMMRPELLRKGDTDTEGRVVRDVDVSAWGRNVFVTWSTGKRTGFRWGSELEINRTPHVFSDAAIKRLQKAFG